MKARLVAGLMGIGVSLSLWTLAQLSGTRLSSLAQGTELPIRGIARGESKIKVGDKAPLVIPEMVTAHQAGKVIALMLGYSSHCPWCDRMERYIYAVMEETKSFGGQAVLIERQTEHAKMIPPHPEGLKLKAAYGVEGQPWLFLIDRQGMVRFVYPVFVPGDLFQQNVAELLQEGQDGRNISWRKGGKE
ncbi:MAG: thioredoxin family protein [Candidatus Tectomicrobia bacterium]|uniref:Thioredoxin family protein n=1 Tax=Tectimicrobiota bacterium TaxID=2528274 RepID=A0A932FV89_UNCTE|nr:thioredoxin family protein [Candidatus Tectomicrobia bacterium]